MSVWIWTASLRVPQWCWGNTQKQQSFSYSLDASRTDSECVFRASEMAQKVCLLAAKVWWTEFDSQNIRGRMEELTQTRHGGHTPFAPVPVFGKQEQADLCEFEANFVYVAISRPTRATYCDPVSTPPRKEKWLMQVVSWSPCKAVSRDHTNTV